MFKSLFRNKKEFDRLLTTVDIHSHLLPGIDDGVDTIEESLEVIKGFKNLGYSRLITTPHIMHDFYKNTPEIILSKLKEVRAAVKNENIEIEIDAAAEYYLDENFLEMIEHDLPLLTFGDNYILFELSFVSKPLTLKEAVFKLLTRGYKPVLAHVERYLYFHREIEQLREIYESGTIFQLNLLSLSGYYSKPVKQMSRKLLSDGLISFIGSDCHNSRQLLALSEVLKSPEMNNLINIDLLNNHL